MKIKADEYYFIASSPLAKQLLACLNAKFEATVVSDVKFYFLIEKKSTSDTKNLRQFDLH